MTTIADAPVTGPAFPFRPFRGVKIDLPTETEIGSIGGLVSDTALRENTLSEWRLITLHYEVGGGDFELVVVGGLPNWEVPFVTVPVAALDLERRYVRTKFGAVYALGDEAVGDVPPGYVEAVRSALVGWGWGDERTAA